MTDFYVDTTITDVRVASSTPDYTTYNPTTFTVGVDGTSSVFARLVDIQLKSFAPGDTVYLRRGQVFEAETMQSNKSSESADWLTYKAFGTGDKPVVVLGYTITDWTEVGSTGIYYGKTTTVRQIKSMSEDIKGAGRKILTFNTSTTALAAGQWHDVVPIRVDTAPDWANPQLGVQDIVVNDDDPGAGTGTITRTSGSWVDEGIVAGSLIKFSGFTNAGNNGTFTVSDVTALVLTLTDATSALVNETDSNGGISYISDLKYYCPSDGVPGDYTVLGHTGDNWYLYTNPTYMKFEDIDFRGASFYAYRVANITWNRCDIFGAPSNAIYLTPKVGAAGTGINITDCTFLECNNNIYFVDGSSVTWTNSTVSGCTMANTGKMGTGIWQDFRGTGADIDGISCQNMASGIIIENNEIYGGYLSTVAAIHLWTGGVNQEGCIVRNNFIHDIPMGDGIFIGGSGTERFGGEIYNNIIVNVGVSSILLTDWSLSGGYSNTYQTALTTQPTAVRENDVSMTLQTSIANVEANPDSFFWASNVLYIHPISNDNPSSNGKTYKSWNLNTGYGYPPKSSGIFIDRLQKTLTKVYNNAIINCGVGIYLFDNSPGNLDIHNNLLYNNIMYQFRKNSTGNTNIDINYNLIYPSTNPTNYTYYNGSARTFAYWQGTLGYDANSQTTDPLLTDSTPDEAADVMLQGGSPCIGAGVNVGFVTDPEGNSYGNVPDIGVYSSTVRQTDKTINNFKANILTR